MTRRRMSWCGSLVLLAVGVPDAHAQDPIEGAPSASQTGPDDEPNEPDAEPDSPGDAPTAEEPKDARSRPPLPAWRDDGWHLDTLAGTQFPLDVGGRIQIETPYRIRVGLDVGFMPGPYQDAIQAVLVEAGAYDQAQAEVVADSLSSAFALGVTLGWRPVVREGFFFDAGYHYVALGGRSTREDALASASGSPLPSDLSRSEEREWTVRSQLHMVTIHLGWEFVPVEHFTVRIRIGGHFTGAANATITPAFDASRVPEPVLRAFTDPSEDWLEENLRRHGHLPSVGLDLGYRWM